MTHVRVGLIGCGRWGRNIARVLAARGELAAIAARRPERIGDTADGYGVAALTPEALLARADVQAVAIAVPPAEHPGLVTAALAAGKAVFVEKPLALNAPAARICADTAERASLTLMVGHTMLHHPAFRRLAALLAEGAIGPVRRITCERFVTRPAAPDESALWLLGPHDVSMVLHLCGRPSGAAGSPTAEGWRLALELPRGVSADISVGMGATAKRALIAVTGQEGSLVFDDTADPGRKLTLHRGGEALSIEVEPAEPLAAEMAWFAEAVRGMRPPLSNAAGAVAVVETLERCQALPMLQ